MTQIVMPQSQPTVGGHRWEESHHIEFQVPQQHSTSLLAHSLNKDPTNSRITDAIDGPIGTHLVLRPAAHKACNGIGDNLRWLDNESVAVLSPDAAMYAPLPMVARLCKSPHSWEE